MRRVDATKKKRARQAESARHSRARKKVDETIRQLILTTLIARVKNSTDEVLLLRRILAEKGDSVTRTCGTNRVILMT